MTPEPANWTRWPHPAAVAEPQADIVVKTAALAYSDHSLEGILQGVVAEIPSWEEDLPPGIEKFADARFGTEDPLPVVTSKNIWRHPNAHPLTVLLLLINRYGQECLEWEPETLRTTLRKDGIQLSDSVWTKIMAVRVVVTSPSPWRQWEQFHWVSYGLAGRAPNFVYLERPEIGFLMSAVDMMRIVDRERPFAEDLDKFTAVVLRDRGIMYAAPPLQFAQEELNDRRIHCQKCGTHEKDDHDIKCVACGSKELTRLSGPFEHLREQTKVLFDARRKFPLEQALDGLAHDAAAQAAYKLLVHNEYRNEVRAQLVTQLRALRKEA